MPISPARAVLIILVCAAITFLLRAFPFAFFGGGKRAPSIVLYLGRVLPFAVIAMLIVYCLKDTSFQAPYFGGAEIIGVLAVIVLHLFKKNTLISVFGGTIVYMLCVQLIFI